MPDNVITFPDGEEIPEELYYKTMALVLLGLLLEGDPKKELIVTKKAMKDAVAVERAGLHLLIRISPAPNGDTIIKLATADMT